MTLNKILPYLIVYFVIGYIAFMGYIYGRYDGYRKGYSTGTEIARKDFDEAVEEMTKNSAESYYRGYDHGQAVGESDCDNRVSIGDNLCKEDLKKAYKAGQLNGMKRIGKLCKIEIK